MTPDHLERLARENSQTKLDRPTIRKKLFEAKAKGMTDPHACDYAGVSYQAFRNFVNKASVEAESAASRLRAGEKITPEQRRAIDFLERLQKTRAKFVQSHLDNVIEASRKASWPIRFKASAFLLAITDPAYSPRRRQELSGPGGGPVEVADHRQLRVQRLIERAAEHGLTLAETRSALLQAGILESDLPPELRGAGLIEAGEMIEAAGDFTPDSVD
jgi:hypothetical protein